MNTDDIVREWCRYAEQDLASAGYLQKMRPMPIEIICYHCQQSVEKYLKAYIASQGGAVQRSHDLVALNRICKQYNLAFAAIDGECLNLTDYGVQARYPFQLELTGQDVTTALQSAKRVEGFIRSQLAVL